MAPSRGVHRQRERADSFGAVARAYDQYRPRYPAQLIDDLVAQRIDTALDVGAGDRHLVTSAGGPRRRRARPRTRSADGGDRRREGDSHSAREVRGLVRRRADVRPDPLRAVVPLGRPRRRAAEGAPNAVRARSPWCWCGTGCFRSTRRAMTWPRSTATMSPARRRPVRPRPATRDQGWTSVGSTTCSRMRDSP